MSVQSLSHVVQQDMFTAGYSDCSFAFEFLPMDVQSTFDVSANFVVTDAEKGFADIDAIGILSVPYAGQFDKVFYLNSDDTDDSALLTGALDTAKYGIIGVDATDPGENPFAKPTIAALKYSDAQIHSGMANNSTEFLNNTILKDDYVRFTAKSITGGYALSDIFNNEVALLSGVEAMNSKFTTELAAKMDTPALKECYDLQTSEGAKTCKQLALGLLNMATSSNAASRARGELFLADLAAQSSSPEAKSRFWIKFHAGDMIALRLNYLPKDGAGSVAKNSAGENLGSNTIADRPYKIYLKLV